MAFTPLVSPAVTPLDPQFNVDSAFPGPAYFSPLASPALHAQGDSTNVFHQQGSGTSGKMSSPIELEVDTSVGGTASSHDLSKRARKNNAAKTARKGSVRQSPISKPQRRKPTTNPAIVAQVLTEAAEGATVAEKGGPKAATDASRRGDAPEENASVSPEALSDMPPPPIPPPRTAGKSPVIRGEMSSPAHRPTVPGGKKPSPATPASLMKLPASSAPSRSATPSPQQHGQVSSDPMDTFQLPESATNFADGQFASPDIPMMSPLEQSHPGASAPFQPLPSPVFAKPSASANQSPQLAAGQSTPGARRTPQLAPRGSSKKRTGSVSVSPALRPKISPNIKPLLPGTAAQSVEDTSKLLASKSNYQNILEGNLPPGVTYPKELSTNLTSKRTSHKIAEQGRRNRINSALQEIAALLPKPCGGVKEKDGRGSEGECGSDGKKEDKTDKNMPSSKASTVEMAIEYIKQLRQEVEEATRRAEEAERKLGMSRT
jgi:hypothetical protein